MGLCLQVGCNGLGLNSIKKEDFKQFRGVSHHPVFRSLISSLLHPTPNISAEVKPSSPFTGMHQ